MTNDEVSDWLYRIRSRAEVCMNEDQNAKAKEAVATAIESLKLTGLLNGRPCEVCANKNGGFCCVWDCPFDGLKEANNADRN